MQNLPPPGLDGSAEGTVTRQDRRNNPSMSTEIDRRIRRLEHLPPRAVAEAHAIYLQVLHDALDVVARLGKRNAFDPVDRIDLGVARIAVLLDPFFEPASAGIVAGENQQVGAGVIPP